MHSKNRAILREMVATDFKIRYQNSALGYMWSLLKPLFLFAILYVVFTYIIPLGKSVEHFSVYLLSGIIFWNFFSEATMTGAGSVVASGDLIRKISIPRYLVVIASSVSALINFGLSLIVIFIFALINGVYPTVEWLLIIPLALEVFILSLGIAFFLSAAYVRFRDITYIWEIFLQAGFYATPILYPMTMVPENLHKWFFINPMAQIIQDARFAIAATSQPTIWTTINSWAVIIPFIVVAFVALFGGLYFRKKSKYFAEDI